METTSSSHKYFQSMLATLAIAILCGVSAPSALAGYIVTLQQTPTGVVATGTGPIDLTGLTPVCSGCGVQGSSAIVPADADIGTGSGSVDFYSGFTGPTSFGSGGVTHATSFSGDAVAMFEDQDSLSLPAGYVSGSPLSDSATYNSQTFSSLGVTPGIYVWTWGTGTNQSFTLHATVPDSGSTFGLLSLALIALFGINRLRAGRLA